MHISLLTTSLSIPHADSLKDKRQVIRSLTARLRQKFNISVSEVEDLDIWRRATIGIVIVSNEAKHNSQVLNKVVEYIENDTEAILDDYQIEDL
jgi:uncharacterized protein